MNQRKNDDVSKLNQLGQGGQTKYAYGSPTPEILETFTNQFRDTPYMVSIAFPEFTSLCPKTGQPDFAEIIVEYIPNERCVESKSFKLYMFAHRNHQSFMETICNNMADDFYGALEPHWLRVKAIFNARGATHLHVFAERFGEVFASEDNIELAEAVRQAVFEWKSESGRHSA